MGVLEAVCDTQRHSAKKEGLLEFMNKQYQPRWTGRLLRNPVCMVHVQLLCNAVLKCAAAGLATLRLRHLVSQGKFWKHEVQNRRQMLHKDFRKCRERWSML